MEDTGVGTLLRRWRTVRRLSQLDLSLEAEVSARHLSFIETGRARPSREMVLLLASVLDVPLRERNALLQSAGFAPVYRETGLEDPVMAGMREAVSLILRQHEPCPALALDRHWSLVMANAPYARFLRLLLGDAVPELPPYAVLPEPRLNTLLPLFDPGGLRPRIGNWEEVARTVLRRVRREAALEGDRRTEEILERLAGFPGVKELLREPEGLGPPGPGDPRRARPRRRCGLPFLQHHHDPGRAAGHHARGAPDRGHARRGRRDRGGASGDVGET